MTAIVYQESDFYIKNITTFSQYVLNLSENLDDTKLITIMGEYHDVKFDCKKDKISKYVDEYIIEQSKDCKTKLILELEDKSYVEEIKADNIKRIITTLETSSVEDIKNIETIYIDYRIKFLDPIFHYKLYNKKNEVIGYSHEVILERYIKPFFEKMDDLSNLDTIIKDYHPLINKLYKTYILNLDTSFRDILTQLDNWDTKPKQIVAFKDIFGLEIKDDIKMYIITEISKLWAKVSDFFLLREFFKLDDTKQYIILIGEYHYFNIVKFLDSTFSSMKDYTLTKIGEDKNIFVIYKFLYGKKTSDDNCIDTKGSVHVVPEDKIKSSKRVNIKRIKKI